MSINGFDSCQSNIHKNEVTLYNLLIDNPVSQKTYKQIQIECQKLYFQKNFSEVLNHEVIKFIDKNDIRDTTSEILTHSEDFSFAAFLLLKVMLKSEEYSDFDPTERITKILTDYKNDSSNGDIYTRLIGACLLKYSYNQRIMLFEQYKYNRKIISKLNAILVRGLSSEAEALSLISYMLRYYDSKSEDLELYKDLIRIGFRYCFKVTDPYSLNDFTFYKRLLESEMNINDKRNLSSLNVDSISTFLDRLYRDPILQRVK
ncbi:MAG: hypothetical protein ABI851_09180 [Saprospiraceae bacterium]